MPAKAVKRLMWSGGAVCEPPLNRYEGGGRALGGAGCQEGRDLPGQSQSSSKEKSHSISELCFKQRGV